MNFKRNLIEDYSLPFNGKYVKAVYGLLHVAFVDKNGAYLLMRDDKKSIEASLDFYKNKISRSKTFPIIQGDEIKEIPFKDKRVLNAVLGLPQPLFESLDLNKDIVSQLRFVIPDFCLKCECYCHFLGNEDWFWDDFRCYCINNGVYLPLSIKFPFDGMTSLPIYLDRSKMNEKYQKLYDSACFDRFSIQVPIFGYHDKTQIDKFYELDKIPFEDRVEYFVDAIDHKEIRSLALSVQDKFNYSFALKAYLISFVRALFDDYSLETLGKRNTQISCMTLDKISENKKPIYSVSSMNAEMFTIDKEHFFFAECERDRIEEIIKEKLSENKELPMVFLYSSFGLPFEGYQYVKDCKKKDAEEILSSLPFEEVSETNCYVSAKKSGLFSSYTSSETKHAEVCYKRGLSRYGIRYLNFDLDTFDKDDGPFSIRIEKKNRPESLKSIFDKRGSVICDTILPCYESVYGSDNELRKIVKRLDEKSSHNILMEFYSMFRISSFSSVVDAILKKYSSVKWSDKLRPFFAYVVRYPFELMKNELRVHFIDRHDRVSLAVLDSEYNLDDREEKLSFPYMDYGDIFCSFKKGIFDKPYICSCQREAIENRINYYDEYYEHFYAPDDGEEFHSGREKGEFILEHLGLPKEISKSIIPVLDIESQIRFRYHICHTCKQIIPSARDGHKAIDLQTAAFEKYLVSELSSGGDFADSIQAFDFKDEKTIVALFLDKLHSGRYHGMIDFDTHYPILSSFVPNSALDFIATICAFHSGDCFNEQFVDDLKQLMELGDRTFYDMFYECDDDTRKIVESFESLFVFYNTILKNFEAAYAIVLSKRFLPFLDSVFCLNEDYNKKLPHPVVVLGKQFNVYTDDDGREFYFSKADKKPLLDFGKRYLDLFRSRYHVNNALLTPLVLGALGLPYQVIKRYMYFDFETYTMKDFVSKLKFEDNIDRNSLNISHCSYIAPFKKAFPFKEDELAEYQFASIDMMRDGFKVCGVSDLKNLTLDLAEQKYCLNDSVFALPFIECPTKELPAIVISQFCPSESKMISLLKSFYEKSKEKDETLKEVCRIIYANYSINVSIFFDLFFTEELDQYRTLGEMVENCFPQVKDLNPDIKEKAEMKIVSFFFYLCQDLIELYVEKEKRIGRDS